MGSKKPSVLIVADLLLAATNLEAAWPPSKCTHARVLAAGDDDEIVEYDDARLENAGPRQLAKSVVKSNRLNCGVIREWERLHLAFVAAGMSEEYYDDDWTEKVGYSVEYLAKAGFMSPYGGEQAIEDIAEMTSWATAG